MRKKCGATSSTDFRSFFCLYKCWSYSPSGWEEVLSSRSVLVVTKRRPRGSSNVCRSPTTRREKVKVWTFTRRVISNGYFSSHPLPIPRKNILVCSKVDVEVKLTTRERRLVGERPGGGWCYVWRVMLRTKRKLGVSNTVNGGWRYVQLFLL